MPSSSKNAPTSAKGRAVPIVVFDSMHAATLEVDAPPGARLVDVCDAHEAPIPFSCRSASCGTCRIVVLEGADALEPPQEDEAALLEMMGDDPATRRLACQARLRAGESDARVRVRAADDW
jgi:2Fe-2S ferredoxin